MIEPDDYLEVIEAYQEHRLTKQEQAAFDQQLQTDKALQTALADYRIFRHSIEAVDLKQRLNNLHDRLDEAGRLTTPPPQPYSGLPVRWGIWQWVAAASILLAVGFGLVRWQQTQQKTNPTRSQMAFAALYKPEPAIRSNTDCPALVVTKYRAGQYKAALADLINIAAPDACSYYYRGLCLLALDQPQSALTSLETARQTADQSLRQRADWYLALAYLKAERPDAARRQLQVITRQTNHPFAVVAQRALAQIAN